ncbi:MAG TPA: hypothetical protein VN901_14105 [Candidatus Acidoferrales bacterium]|nr:hypothetical protein [Candidatus Acidoferrales bacterium]
MVSECVRTTVAGRGEHEGEHRYPAGRLTRLGAFLYQDLLAFRAKTNKYVYVLASHSHFLIEDVYNDACHQRPETYCQAG